MHALAGDLITLIDRARISVVTECRVALTLAGVILTAVRICHNGLMAPLCRIGTDSLTYRRGPGLKHDVADIWIGIAAITGSHLKDSLRRLVNRLGRALPARRHRASPLRAAGQRRVRLAILRQQDAIATNCLGSICLNRSRLFAYRACRTVGNAVGCDAGGQSAEIHMTQT